MDNTTKWILFIFFAPGLIWDASTTFSGVSQYTNGGIFPIILTIFINGILAFTFIRMQKTDFTGFLTGVMWLGALSGDLITSFFGNWNVANIQNPSPMQFFLIGLAALFTTGATISVSYMVFKEDIFGFYPARR